MVTDDALQEAAGLLAASESLVVLTGAGISAESGVPTFRGQDGLWEGYRVEEVATPEAFARDPRFVWEFYNHRRQLLGAVQPNPAHHALVTLERRCAPFTLITQNVDGLHRLAGSRNVLEIHGNLWRVRCTGCAALIDKTGQVLPELPKCERCHGLLRPDVVWFGEALPDQLWDQATAALADCDGMLVVGTSAVVYPAAGLVYAARQCGTPVIEVNLESTPASDLATVTLLGKAGTILPELVRRSSFGERPTASGERPA